MPTNFVYINDIPAANNKPSGDQPNMRTNTNSIDSLINVDHLSFETAVGVESDGYHKSIHQVPFSTVTSNPPNNNPLTAPATFTTGGVIFTAEVNNPNGGKTDTNLYFKSEQGQVSQLTGFTPTNLTQASFITNGYYLSGPIIFQWGSASIGAGTHVQNNVLFNVPFPNACLNVTATLRPSAGAQTEPRAVISINTISTTQFNFVCNTNTSGAYPNFYWHAIGF